jgi:hypothetical protein
VTTDPTVFERAHALDRTCWCGPRILRQPGGAEVIVHHKHTAAARWAVAVRITVILLVPSFLLGAAVGVVAAWASVPFPVVVAVSFVSGWWVACTIGTALDQ